MQQYGYKSGYSVSLKIRRGGQCNCCCCEAAENKNRKAEKRNKKIARQAAKKEIAVE